MDFFKTKKQSGYRLPVSVGMTGIFLLTLIIITYSSGMGAIPEESEALKEDVNKGVIINRHGTKMGSVDENGNVFNISGIFLGSVDKDGNIINVSRIDMGKVTKEGSVLNQSGTVLGSVNSNGEIFNVSGGKMGEVKGEADLNRIGAAARLIILK